MYSRLEWIALLGAALLLLLVAVIEPGAAAQRADRPVSAPVGPAAGATQAPMAPSLCAGPNPFTNPDFELGNFTGWTMGGSNPPAIGPGRTGCCSAQLRVNGSQTTAVIYQMITVPPAGGTLRFWYKPAMPLPMGGGQRVYVKNAGGTILATIMDISENTQVWTPRTFDMAAFAGQQVRVEFQTWIINGAGVGETDLDDIEWLGPCATATSTPTATVTPSPTPACSVPLSHRILIVHADSATPPTVLRSQLLALPGVSAVDLYEGQFETPPLALLQQYDTVVPFSNYGFADGVALGTNLAAFVDGGGVVVAFNYVWSNPPSSLRGQWQTGGYAPFNSGALPVFTPVALGTYTQGHPLMQGVTTLNGPSHMQATLTTGATQVATWSDGSPLIAFKGRVVGVTAYVGEYERTHWSGDFARIVLNAADWLGHRSCATPGSTATPTPVFVGHVTWQGRPAQPDTRNQVPIMVRLRLGNTVTTYQGLTTTASGVFTVPVSTLPQGVYSWWVKGWYQLATSGTVTLAGAPVTRQEMGTQPAGDINGDNLVDVTDFGQLRASFGTACGDSGYNSIADYTTDCLVDISDFGLLRGNFGQAGPSGP